MLTLCSLAFAGAKALCTLSVPLATARRACLQAAAVALLALSTFGLAGGGPAQAAPATLVDAIGRSVTIEAPAQRIVLMFNYEEATAVAGPAGWDRIVGISKGLWAGWRPAIWQRYVAVVPRIGEAADVGNTEDGDFSVEKTIALKPSVIVMPEWAYSSLKTAREQLEAAGIPIVVIDYNAQTVERHAASTRALGVVFGAQARAEELAALYEKEMADIRRRVASATGAKAKVYVELGQAGPETVGNSYTTTMWGKILDALGAENIAIGRVPGPWGPVNPEYVLAANPDVIFIAGSSWLNRPKAVKTGYGTEPETTRQSIAPYATRAGWENLKAVKTGEVHAIEHGLARTLFDFAATQYIAKRLYPAAFADVDPVASLRRYHEAYLPVPFSGTWMLPLKP